MVKLIVLQSWETACAYPSHYVYTVCIYRDDKVDSKVASQRLCESKAETVAFIEGVTHTFRLYNEKCDIEYVTADGEPGNYHDYFLQEHGHYLND